MPDNPYVIAAIVLGIAAVAAIALLKGGLANIRVSKDGVHVKAGREPQQGSAKGEALNGAVLIDSAVGNVTGVDQTGDMSTQIEGSAGNKGTIKRSKIGDITGAVSRPSPKG